MSRGAILQYRNIGSAHYRQTAVIDQSSWRAKPNEVRCTGGRRLQRRLRARATAADRCNCPRNARRKDPHTERSNTTYNRNRARYNSWLTNKGWRGTIADNRVPPRGAVGEPRHILSPSTRLVVGRGGCQRRRNFWEGRRVKLKF